MLLDAPLDDQRIAKIKAMSDEEKVRLAKAAHAEFMQILKEIGDKERELLQTELDKAEQQAINNVLGTIQHM